jgi:cytosine/adenosine deaminase-related metal-dependent hydrolase
VADSTRRSKAAPKPAPAKSGSKSTARSANGVKKAAGANAVAPLKGAKPAKDKALPATKAATTKAAGKLKATPGPARPIPKGAAEKALSNKQMAKPAAKSTSKTSAKVQGKPATRVGPVKGAAMKVSLPKAITAKPVMTSASRPKPAAKPAVALKVKELQAPGGGSLLLQGGTFVTMNMVREVLTGDLRIEQGRITGLGERLKPRKDEKVLDLRGLTIFPGFIQLHVHLCQTLFRHMAEDMALFDWLRNRIWPLEAAHNPASMGASARLGILELLLSGTTTVFTMESTQHTETVFQELSASGLRAFSGKAMMDSGRGVPADLKEETARSLDTARRHLADWNGKGRLGVTLCPRFAPSCSADLLRGVGTLARESGAWIHTHIAETRDEVQLTREVFGRNPVQLYEALGYLEGKFLGVHAVHLTEAEKLHLAGRRGAVLVHCPSANLKLGSGVMPLSDLLSRGIRVGLGADGAACNNNLSVLQEMRLAGLLQKVSRGAATLSAEMLLDLATIDAAKSIGLDEEIGSIEVGKKADLVFFDLNHPSIQVAGTPAQQLVWSASSRDLVHTMIEGEFLVRDRKARRLDAEDVMKTARAEARKLVLRAGLEGKVRV